MNNIETNPDNVIYGSYGAFEPVPAELDTPEEWESHDAEAEAYFAARDAEAMMDFYDYEPSPYFGDYSEM